MVSSILSGIVLQSSTLARVNGAAAKSASTVKTQRSNSLAAASGKSMASMRKASATASLSTAAGGIGTSDFQKNIDELKAANVSHSLSFSCSRLFESVKPFLDLFGKILRRRFV